jgi:hypothetical protein
MKKSVTPLLLAFSILTLSGCASYNSVAPEWAKIGSENSETTSEEAKAESVEETHDEKPWWNPTSWF